MSFILTYFSPFKNDRTLNTSKHVLVVIVMKMYENLKMHNHRYEPVDGRDLKKHCARERLVKSLRPLICSPLPALNSLPINV